MSIFKESVYRHCLQVVEDKINKIAVRQNGLKEALGNETKSTAGDKYETARAMLHLEQEQAAQQLAEATAQNHALLQIGMGAANTEVRLGSLVKTNKAWFFICIGLGRQVIEGQEVYVISGAAPLGKQLLGRCIGEEIRFGACIYVIEVLL